jgi:hypothetical protein
MLASNNLLWRLHPEEQQRALHVYFLPSNQTAEILGVGRARQTVNGRGNAPKDVVFPMPDLDMGVFGD